MLTPIINVFLVDDHQVLLDGLKLLLKDTPGIQIVGTAQNGRELLEYLQSNEHAKSNVDLILMDINMPVMDGMEATRQVKLHYPDIKVIMLTMNDQMPDVNAAVAQGADGFLSKNNGKKEILDTIKKVHNSGEFVLYTDLDKTACTGPAAVETETPQIHLLSEREKLIIRLICREKDIEAIAATLALSQLSISAQRKNILSKLGVSTDIGIVREAMKLGLCD